MVLSLHRVRRNEGSAGDRRITSGQLKLLTEETVPRHSQQDSSSGHQGDIQLRTQRKDYREHPAQRSPGAFSGRAQGSLSSARQEGTMNIQEEEAGA